MQNIQMLIFQYLFYHEYWNQFVFLIHFFKSGYAALSSIALFTVITTLIAIIPQEESKISFVNELSLNEITYSWYYAISVLYLLVCLGFIIIKRLIPFNYKNILFFINHFGLWLVLFSANLGHADKISLNMMIPEGEKVWYAFNSNGKRYDLNYAIELIELKLESSTKDSSITKYEANVKILTNQNQNGYNADILVNKPININDWKIYLNGYFKKNNKNIVILTLVKDKWLYVTYFGFILVFIGSILLIFNKNHLIRTKQ